MLLFFKKTVKIVSQPSYCFRASSLVCICRIARAQTLKRIIVSAEDRKKEAEKEPEEKTGRYQRGSHRFVFYIKIFLRLVEVQCAIS